MDNLLIQKITHMRTGEEVDISFLKGFTLIEPMDLSGPTGIFIFDDTFSSLRDGVGILEGDIFRVTLDDLYTDESGAINEEIDFTVLSRPLIDDHLQINVISKPIFNTKKKTTSAQVFNRKSAGNILNRLFPTLTPDVSRFPIIEDYHNLSGERASAMIRQMAREQGAHIYQRRKHICMHRLSDILNRTEPDIVYHHNDMTKVNQIITYQALSPQHILKDKIERRNSGWNMTDGWITGSGVLPGKSFSRQSSASKVTLGNIAHAAVPILDLTCHGNGKLMPGLCMEIVWHNIYRQDMPIDESLPDRAVVWLVAHHYSSNEYFCRVKLARPLRDLS